MSSLKKYEKYLMEVDKKASGNWECMQGAFQDVLYYDNRFHSETPNLLAFGLRYAPGSEGAGTIVKYPDHEEPDLPHAHGSSEHFIYLGLDPENPNDLGGSFDIWLGAGDEAELYTIDKPTCVFMPRNTVHLPAVFKEVRKPYGVLVVMNTPQRALYLVDKLPTGFKAGNILDYKTPEQKSGVKKYARCFIERDPNETDYFPSHKGKSHLLIRQDLRKHNEATNSIEVNLIYGAGIGWGCGDMMQMPNYQAPSLPHKHAWAEHYCFVGTDHRHPDELGGTVEFWIGEGDEAEQYLISKPTVILVPPNTLHLPMYIREVRKPFLAVTVLDTPLAAELPVRTFPPEFKHVVK